MRTSTPLRRVVLGPDFTSHTSTRLGRDNRLSPVGFDVAAGRFSRNGVRPCHICGSCIPYQHRFWWCQQQLEKEVARGRRHAVPNS